MLLSPGPGGRCAAVHQRLLEQRVRDQDVPDVTEALNRSDHVLLEVQDASEWLAVAAASPQFCAVNIRPATICGTPRGNGLT
jgi:hypothetical protein